jgi:bifunctional ADP-heptose synthase (sugar kinase/adenylyltransferase)
VDTRNKILTPASLALPLPGPVALVAGHFDIIRAEHARELQAVRDRAAARTLVVAVLPLAAELLPQRVRAELVAALRMVDYVVIADTAELESLVDALKPAEVVRLEAADAQRTRQLIEHVHSRQTR